MDRSNEIQVLYHRFLEAWNCRNARAMADLFADRGELIGYDGSLEIGRENVFFLRRNNQRNKGFFVPHGEFIY